MRYFASSESLKPSIISDIFKDIFGLNAAKYYGDNFAMYPTHFIVENENKVLNTFNCVSS
jgi:hypothetical protein